jgi:phosphatidylinositol glycan class O
MDEDTVLMVFGDHGMTDDGNHGGASQQELRSVLFSYSKSGFSMKQKLL